MRLGVGFLILAGVCWGTAGTLGTLLVRATGLPFAAVAGYRIAIGGALMLAIILVRRSAVWPATAAAWRRVALIGGCLLGFQVCFFAAVSQVGVSVATLVAIGSTPVIVTIADIATGKHRWNAQVLTSLGLALMGVGLLAGVPEQGLDARRLALGCLLALGAGITFAIITLAGSRPVPGFDNATGMGVGMLGGGLVALGLATTSGPIGFALSPASVALVLALGLLPSAVAYLAFVRGLRTESATTASLISLLEPVTGVVVAAIVLGERLGAAGIAGACALLTAVALAAVPGQQLSALRRRLSVANSVG